MSMFCFCISSIWGDLKSAYVMDFELIFILLSVYFDLTWFRWCRISVRNTCIWSDILYEKMSLSVISLIRPYYNCKSPVFMIQFTYFDDFKLCQILIKRLVSWFDKLWYLQLLKSRYIFEILDTDSLIVKIYIISIKWHIIHSWW